jgi:hypothetical protein
MDQIQRVKSLDSITGSRKKGEKLAGGVLIFASTFWPIPGLPTLLFGHPGIPFCVENGPDSPIRTNKGVVWYEKGFINLAFDDGLTHTFLKHTRQIAPLSIRKQVQCHPGISGMSAQTFWDIWLEAELPHNVNEKLSFSNQFGMSTAVESVRMFPEMTVLAKRFLSLPASEVACERVMSALRKRLWPLRMSSSEALALPGLGQ